MDANLLHISYEGNALEDPWQEAEDSMWTRSVDPVDAPNTPEYIEVEFEEGNAVALNGERLSPAVMLTKLNELGGKHGTLPRPRPAVCALRTGPTAVHVDSRDRPDTAVAVTRRHGDLDSCLRAITVTRFALLGPCSQWHTPSPQSLLLFRS